MKKVGIIGTGYVGLVSGACFAYLGHDVICVDTDQEKINILNSGKSTIYEEGLDNLLQQSKNITFTTDLTKAINNSEIIFVCVGTPEKVDGSADLTYVFEVIDGIAKEAKEPKVVVIKSTMPVEVVPDILSKLATSDVHFDLVSNPEFLAQGTAIKDFLEPDRVVIGAENDEAYEKVASLYEKIDAPLVKTNVTSAILTKYAANAFLATKVSFINTIARLCEKVGANINDVSYGMGLDKRVGNRFLNAGIGYGGSCFPKDTKALVKTGDKLGVNLDILKAVDDINITQRKLVIEKLQKHLKDLREKQIALLGLAFKPGTDDFREAPSIYLIDDLSKMNTKLNAYDPIVKNVNGMNGKADIKEEVYEAVEGADAIVFVTEHPEFKKLDFSKIKNMARGNVIIDGRNFLEADKLKEQGFIYEGIGV